jgi:hypothetical protein
MFDTHKNFAIGTVLSAPADASGEDFILMPGDGQFFAPNMPVTLCPPNAQPTADNSEIGYLTAVEGDTLTITRAQEGTLPMQVAGNWQIFGSLTAKSLQDIEGELSGALAQLDGKQPAGEYATDEDLAAALETKATLEHTHTESDIRDLDKYTQAEVDDALATKANAEDLAPVAESGSYIDLTNKPTIITDHGALSGLNDDDHPQYHNDTRGDVRYYTKAANNALLNGKSNVAHDHTAADVTDFDTAADARIASAAGVSIASLTGGLVPTSQLPSLSFTTVQTAATQAAMLALTAQEGDVVVRTDTNQTYMRNAGTSGTMTDFTLLNTPADAVTSVNGQVGIIVLGKGDVGLSNVDNTSDENKPVSAATQAALDNKRTIITAADRVYTTGTGGVQNSWVFSYAPTIDTFALRTTGGQLRVGVPALSDSATTKLYVDTATALLLPLAGGTMTGALTTTGLAVIAPVGSISATSQSANTFSSGLDVRKRGTTGDATAAVTSGSEIGYHSFTGWQGSAYKRLAYVIVSADGDITPTTGGGIYKIATRNAAGTEAIRLQASDAGIYSGAHLTYSVGLPANYWQNGFIQTLNLNSTASISGATAGVLSITGSVFTSSSITANGAVAAINFISSTAVRTAAVTLGGAASAGIEICDATAGAFTLTLPSATTGSGNSGRQFVVKKIDATANAITIATQASQTIDGASTYSLPTRWKYVVLVSDGNNWMIVANN